MKVGSALYNRLFGEQEQIQAAESSKSEERLAAVRELVSRPGFRSEVLDWLQDVVHRARIVPGKHEDMLYMTGYRNGLETVLERMKSLQEEAKESYDV